MPTFPVLRSFPMTLLRGVSFRAANAADDPADALKLRQALLNKFDRYDGFLNGARQGMRRALDPAKDVATSGG
eukprot:scaffold109_cov252-Pinguiococcus_pyrenoidosus.AAC.48